MSRAASEIPACRGFTLVEIMAALAGSGILLLMVTRFFKDFNHSFDIQEQVMERDMNGNYAVKRLSETLMSAGANLPSRGWDVISLPEGNPGARLRLSVNPGGGVEYIAAPEHAAYELAIDDPKAFAKADAILVHPMDSTAASYQVPIDKGYHAGGFVKGIKASKTGSRVRLARPVDLDYGDVVYALAIEDYRLEEGDLMMNGMVLAENIGALSFHLLDAGQTAATHWSAMRSARVEVTAQTRGRDPHLPEDGGYRKIDLAMDLLLRNRL